MENINNFSTEDLQKYPYHNQQLSNQDDKDPRENANTGDWGDINENDEAGTDPHRYDQGENNNSGGSGSAGSVANNS